MVEGVCYHLRWMLECQKEKIKVSDTIRFVGGGALSPVMAQMLADITGHKVDVTTNPQNVGSVGAAAVIGTGLGIIQKLETAKEYVSVEQSFIPNERTRAVYERNYQVFKRLYKCNKKNFKDLHTNVEVVGNEFSQLS